MVLPDIRYLNYRGQVRGFVLEQFRYNEANEPLPLELTIQMSNSCLFIKCEIRFSDLFYQVETALPAPV